MVNPVSRERLADLLWPYQGSEQARHSLRNCLLELRKALGPNTGSYLAADFANCRLQNVVTDLDCFEKLSRSQRRSELQTAANLYRGEFLADFDIDSEPFQEWLAAERDRTLAVVCDVLQRLTSAHAAAAEHDAAIHTGRRLVALDPLSELGQRTLMRAYARAGRRGEALRQYKSCVETLKRELGVAPDAETQALAADIARSGAAPRSDTLNPAIEDQRWAGAEAASPEQRTMPVAASSSGNAAPGDGGAAVALLVAEHWGRGGAGAQPDRQSRAAISCRGVHRRSGHRSSSPWPRAFIEAAGGRAGGSKQSGQSERAGI